MRHAAITGWGKCLPPAVLTNQDLAELVDTDDEWITSRTGMKERRISHVPVSDLAHVACARALAAAGREPADVGMIFFGSCSFDDMVPNSASRVQKLLGAANAACVDVNTACTSGMYGLSLANAMIRSGVVDSALVIGAEVISWVMDWPDRNVSVLFGDGAAAFYLEQSDAETGVIAESLGCFGDSREILTVNGLGLAKSNQGWQVGCTHWDFEGQEIFKKAIAGMEQASQAALAKAGLGMDDVDLVVPHQANIRIIEFLGRRLRIPEDKVFVNIQRYANMSAATAPVALVEALEEGRVKPGAHILVPAFGGGLTWSAHLLRWGERTVPLGKADVDLPPCDKSGLQLVQGFMAAKQAHGLATPAG